MCYSSGPGLTIASSFLEIPEVLVLEHMQCFAIKMTEGEATVIVAVHVKAANTFNHLIHTRFKDAQDNSQIPWKCSYRLETAHVGGSSQTLVVYLHDGWPDPMPHNQDSLMEMTTFFVNFDLKTRKPIPWHEEIITKASNCRIPTKSDRMSLICPPLSPPDEAFKYSFVIKPEYIDSRGHMSFTAYLFIIAEGMSQGKCHGGLPAHSPDVSSDYLEEVSILFRNEAMLGETIDVLLWTAEDPMTCYAQLSRADCLISFAKIVYSKSPLNNNL